MKNSKLNLKKWVYIIVGIFFLLYFYWLASLFQKPHEDDKFRVTPIPIDNTVTTNPPVTPKPEVMGQISPGDSTQEPIERLAYNIFNTLSPTVERVSIRPFPQPIIRNSKLADTNPSVLVVGGTDGSGTRRVVQILTQLGVTMVSEDPETYDIHADIVGGWPEMVAPVVRHARKLDYSLDEFPLSLKDSVSDKVEKVLEQVQRDSTKPTSYRLAVGGVLPKGKGALSSKIQYGFKAPVAMTLSPLWADKLQHFKLLHVLRDGRDIAFSANQGPVEKFYKDMYGVQNIHHYPLPVQGIQLWSDWNSQIYHWALHYVQRIDKNNDKMSNNELQKSFGYYILHSEDLVNPSVTVKFAAIQYLAQFVGSNLKNDELCCIAVRDSEFMGSHDRMQVKKRDAEAQLASRYGKWKNKLDNNKVLSDQMYKVGSEGLKIFGYEPIRELADDSMTTDSGYQCTLTPEQCGETELSLNIDVKEWENNGECQIKAGVDYKGEDISAYEMPNGLKSSCCKQCKLTPNCKYFTIDPFAGQFGICYLKHGKTKEVKRDGLLSGGVV